MPSVSGNVGAVFNGGTITTPLNDAPGSNAVNDLLLVTEPASYAALGPTGNAIRVTDGTHDIFLVDAYGDLFVTAPPGQAGAEISLTGADGHNATLNSSTGLSLSSNQAISAGAITATTALLLPGIPTADPHVVGQLYSVTGIVHVSAG